MERIASPPRESTCCFTGHRRLPAEGLRTLAGRLEAELRGLISRGFCRFCAGGALGFDTLAAEAVLALREEFSHLSLLLLLPCRDQAARWRPEEVRRYEQIKREADAVEYVGERYARGCMQRRNRALVERSDLCVCYLTRSTGWTKYTVEYAAKRGLPILNLAGGGCRVVLG